MWRQLQYNLAKLLNFPIKPESDVRVRNMLVALEQQGSFHFKIERHKNGWTAECENVKGIVTGGTNPDPAQEEIDAQIKDAIFTAFGVPAYLCKDNLIRNTEKPATELVYARR